MIMKNPTHPGIIFGEDYLKPLNISIKNAANILGCSRKHISNIVNGNVSITADMATRISKMTNTSPKLWLNIQNNYDLSQLDMKVYQQIKSEVNIPVITP